MGVLIDIFVADAGHAETISKAVSLKDFTSEPQGPLWGRMVEINSLPS